MPTDTFNDQPFTRMADRIKHNADAKFGGACVLIPPSGDSIELLMLDAAGDQAQFWSTILTRIQVAMSNLQEKERIANTFGRR